MRLPLLFAALLLCTTTAAAHEGGADTHGVTARSTTDEHTIEGSVVVRGTVRAHLPLLYRVERWPDVLTDVRAVVAREGAPWSVDFGRFGHAHDFSVTRANGAVVFALAQDSHGVGRLEYRLAPLDAERSVLSVRYRMGTPAGFTAAQTIALLRGKAAQDLADFERAASGAR